MVNSLTLNKVAAAFVAVAMMGGLAIAFTAERALALTYSEYVALFVTAGFDADEAESIAKLLGGEETAAPVMACNFTRNLTTGDTGADVKALQQLLNGKNFTVSASGAGSAGMESEYYGPATAAAVAKMQEAFAADILAPLGLTTGTGNFGEKTRAKANSLCAAVVPPTPGDEDEDTDSDLSGGEASFEDFDGKNSPNSTDVQEGDEEVAVGAWEFDVEDADAELNRVDVMFQIYDGTNGVTSDEPWDYLEAVQLWVNGEMVDEMAADDEDAWDDMTAKDFVGNITTEESYRMRFTGLDEKLDEGETAEVAVSVTLAGNLDSDDEDAEFTVWIPENGIRAVDGAGLDVYTGEEDDTDEASISEERTFMLEQAGGDEEIKISLSTSNPDAATIKVDENDETNDVEVFVFDIEAEESDMEVQTITLGVNITGDTYNSVVSDVALEIDGQVFDDVAVTDGANATLVFDIDGDFVIDADDEVTAKLLVTFLEQDGNYANGTQILAEFDSIVADGVEDNVDYTGDATGESHQLLATGVFAEVVSTKAETTKDQDGVITRVDYTIKYDVTAFEGDFYVGATTARDSNTTLAAASSTGAHYVVENAVSTVLITGTASGVLTSTADESVNGNYVVRDGETETFTLVVTLLATEDPGATFNGVVAAGAVTRARLLGVGYGAADNADMESLHAAVPAKDYRSDTVTW